MNNAELIKALRYCISDEYVEKGCLICQICAPRQGEMKCNSQDDAIKYAADALEAAEQRIAELEAQLPKEGEWIEVKDWLQIPQEDSGTYRCSACGQVMKYPWSYCPNCGAKMKGEQE